jgi:hypothetical protein
VDIKEIADDIAALNRARKFDEAGEKYWSDDVVSLEAQEGPYAVCRGIEEVRAKGAWFESVAEVHGMEVEGPFINGDQFILRFLMDFTRKDIDTRITMAEMGLFTVRDGKVIEERYFY